MNLWSTVICSMGDEREESNDYDLTFGLTDDELTERFVQAVRLAIERDKIMGIPVIRVNADGRIYKEYPDGHMEYLPSDDKRE